MPVKVRILLAEDHGILRQGLRALLEREPGWTVVAEASDGRSAVRLAAELEPDIAILDIGIPKLSGIEAARQITGAGRATKVIALSMHSHRRFVVEMLRAGAAGYVLKDTAFEELARAVREVLSGRNYLCPRLASEFIRELACGDWVASSDAYRLLTGREREVLQLIAEGRSTKEISGDLAVSVKTIETFRQSIMRKLGVSSVAGLTKFALREGLTQIDP